MANVAQTTVYAMRREVEAKFDRLPLKFFDARTRGEVMSRAVNDMDSISATLQQTLTQLLTSVLTLIGVTVMMLTISWILTLVTLLTLPLSLVVVAASRSGRAVLHEAAGCARRAERPCRRDVRRARDRHGIRPREEVDCDLRRAQREPTTTARGAPSSSAASSCRR
jgi:ATP-binding cassette subfamily B protein